MQNLRKSVKQGEDCDATKYTDSSRWKHIESIQREGERDRERGDIDMIVLKLCNNALQCDYPCSHTFDGELLYLAIHHTRTRCMFKLT